MMRSAKAYKSEIDECIKQVDDLLRLSQDENLPDAVKQLSSFSSIMKTLTALKVKIEAIREKVDTHYWLNETLFEKKCLLIHQYTEKLHDRFFTLFNRQAERYLNALLEEGLPATKDDLTTLNALVEVIAFRGETYLPSEYRFRKQLDCICYFEAKAKGKMVQAITLGERPVYFYEDLLSRLSSLSMSVLGLSETSLDKGVQSEFEIQQAIQLRADEVKRLLARKSPTDELDVVVYTAELSQALSLLSRDHEKIVAHNDEMYQKARSLLTNIDLILPRIKASSLGYHAENENMRLQEALQALQENIIQVESLSQSLRCELVKTRDGILFNKLSEKIDKLKTLKRNLFKANSRYDDLLDAAKYTALLEKKKYFLAEYWDFKDRLYPLFKRRVLVHLKEGLLDKKNTNTYLNIMLDVKHFFDSTKTVLPQAPERLKERDVEALTLADYQTFLASLRHLKFRLFPLLGTLQDEETRHFEHHHFEDIAVTLFKETYKNSHTFNAYTQNTVKVRLIDNWIANIKRFSQLHPDQSYFKDLLNGCWALKSKCNKPYSDYQFASDAVQFLQKSCNEKMLIGVSRYQNEWLYQLRIRLFKPLYEFCYRVGFFNERRISLFGCPIEVQMREMIYQARQDCFQIQQGNQPTNGAYVARTFRTEFVRRDPLPVPA